MENPAKVDLNADRWVACVRQMVFVGYNFTSAAFLAEARATGDAPGAAPISLTAVGSITTQGIFVVYGGTDTITNHIAAGRLAELPVAINPATHLPYALADSVALTVISLRINQSTMAGLPFPDVRGTVLEMVWDMLITPAAGIRDKYVYGQFNVRPGASQ